MKTEKKATGKRSSAKAQQSKDISAEVYAAIAMALHQEGYDIHDENPKLTIRRATIASAWTLKTEVMLKQPQRY
ncbi:hypothetical protein [Porphyromonas crevioricanis]|nr:hypothetical protein [Porphyromonas crevioricanis]GAD06074.1 hypothetical protein PORCRE_1796 [Porphyromonas crevioricanis JCM 15906]GAD06976.1 hypothetical protein PORCAN_587 [Porphyromonas crevioricanis JCM 13913]SJZ62228.1 hypothetical protein SAMN02745203_00357 [Porphyromonas crevioricanis]SQH72861.1 Uncharacterised protein [Porphyromonas crevioricanis]